MSINIVMCGGFSPGARVLRAALRNLSAKEDIRVITLGQYLAGLGKAVEEMSALDMSNTVVIDACEGGCASQGLAKMCVKAKASTFLNKYPVVNEKNIKETEDRIAKFLSEVRGR